MGTFIPEYPLFSRNDIPQCLNKEIFVQKMWWILATLTLLMAVCCSLTAVQQHAAASRSDKELQLWLVFVWWDVCDSFTGGQRQKILSELREEDGWLSGTSYIFHICFLFHKYLTKNLRRIQPKWFSTTLRMLERLQPWLWPAANYCAHFCLNIYIHTCTFHPDLLSPKTSSTWGFSAIYSQF